MDVFITTVTFTLKFRSKLLFWCRILFESTKLVENKTGGVFFRHTVQGLPFQIRGTLVFRKNNRETKDSRTFDNNFTERVPFTCDLYNLFTVKVDYQESGLVTPSNFPKVVKNHVVESLRDVGIWTPGTVLVPSTVHTGPTHTLDGSLKVFSTISFNNYHGCIV